MIDWCVNLNPPICFHSETGELNTWMIGTATIDSFVDHIIDDLLNSLELSADLVIYRDKEEYLESVLHILGENLNLCPKCPSLTLSDLIYAVYSCSFNHIHSCLSYQDMIEMILKVYMS